jgi:cytochrome c-type biogenesis protein CcmH/NrfF
MPQPETKLVTPASLAVDAVLVIAFFIYMYGVVSTHVPSKDHRMVLLWGAAGAACLSMVFWLTVQMFRVVLRVQREGAKES